MTYLTLLAQLLASAWLTRHAHRSDSARLFAHWVGRVAAMGVVS